MKKKLPSGVNLRKDKGGRFLLVDVADALKVPHKIAYREAQKLLDTCPVLTAEFSEVTAHASRGGKWLTSYRMTAAGLFALWGWIDTRRASRLFFDVMCPAAGEMLKQKATAAPAPVQGKTALQIAMKAALQKPGVSKDS